MTIKKNIQSMYQKKECCEEKYTYSVLIEVKENIHYVVIKKFNTFVYDHTLHCRKKICCYSL